MTRRVAAVLASSPPMRFVGGELATHALLRHLAGGGWSVTVHCQRTPLPYRWEGVHVVPYRDGWPVDADVLLTHPDVQNDSRAVADRAGIPLVYLVHNTDPVTLAELGRRRADAVMFAAANTREQVLGVFGDVDGPVVPPTVAAVDTTGWDGPRDQVTCVNLADAKGGLTFMYLAAELRHMRFLGVSGGHGIQAVTNGMLPNLQVIPQQPPSNMPAAVYARTRVLVMPTMKESYGMVGVEAMWSGIPVVASDLPGTREALGDAAVFVPAGDSAALAAAVLSLDNPDVYADRSARSRARAEQQQMEAAQGLRCATDVLERAARK